jgi:hypothetical protein
MIGFESYSSLARMAFLNLNGFYIEALFVVGD